MASTVQPKREVRDARAAVAVDPARASAAPAVPAARGASRAASPGGYSGMSISSRSAQPTPQASARLRMMGASRARSAGVRTFESARPRMRRRGSRITAAATTGPASGPRPASSTPATRARSRSLQCRCIAHLQRRGRGQGGRKRTARRRAEDRVRGARGAAAAQRAVHRGEFLLQLTHVRGILQFRKQRVAERRPPSPAPGRTPGTRRRPASRFGCEKYRTFTRLKGPQQKRGQRRSRGRRPPSAAR